MAQRPLANMCFFLNCYFRSKGNFSKMHVRTTKKAQCISVYGVNLFNNLNNAIKNGKNIFVFKRRFKKYTLLKYVDG